MVKDRTDFECVVVGAGILGLSVARSISKRNKKVLVLEKNRRFGEETSSRNSGVIHGNLLSKKISKINFLCKR